MNFYADTILSIWLVYHFFSYYQSSFSNLKILSRLSEHLYYTKVFRSKSSCIVWCKMKKGLSGKAENRNMMRVSPVIVYNWYWLIFLLNWKLRSQDVNIWFLILCSEFRGRKRSLHFMLKIVTSMLNNNHDVRAVFIIIKWTRKSKWIFNLRNASLNIWYKNQSLVHHHNTRSNEYLFQILWYYLMQ
jgi:hypothetical protein